MVKGSSLVYNGIFDTQKGVSIVSESTFDTQKGVSILNTNNIFILICDTDGNPLVADLTISGGSSLDGVYQGFNNHFLTSATESQITFTGSIQGFISDSVTVNLQDGIYQEIKLELESLKINFQCSTTWMNEFRSVVTKPLSTGFVEVVFTGSANIDKDDYSVIFEAFPVGGNKYNSIVLDYELLEETPNSFSYKVAVVENSGDYCYLSNIIKNEC